MIVAANKCDKLSAAEKASCTGMIRETLALPPEIPVILFSAEKGRTGKNCLKRL